MHTTAAVDMSRGFKFLDVVVPKKRAIELSWGKKDLTGR